MEPQEERLGNTAAPPPAGLAAVPAGPSSRGCRVFPDPHHRPAAHTAGRPAAPEQRGGRGGEAGGPSLQALLLALRRAPNSVL